MANLKRGGGSIAGNKKAAESILRFLPLVVKLIVWSAIKGSRESDCVFA